MNPYSFSRPVTDPAMFYGYRPELDFIVSKVTSPNNPTSIAVMGGNGIGKTTLLRQAERRLRTLEIQQFEDKGLVVPLYLDMLQLDDVTPSDFLGKAGHLLNRYLSKNPPSFPLSPQVKTLLESIRTDAEPTDAFIDALFELVEAAHPFPIRIVLLVDDLWRVKRQEQGKVLTSIIRALAIEPSLDQVIACVITGNYQDKEVDLNEPGSPLDNLLRVIELHAFDEEQSLAMINEPTAGKIPQEVAHKVYLNTGGHPLLLQGLMWELCECEDLTQLTVEDVQQAAGYFLKERRDFERWREKMSDADRQVYEVFCQQGQASPDDLHRMMLNVPAGEGRNIILNKPKILDSLRILRTMGLIRELEDGDQELVHELAGRWYADWFLQMNRPTRSLVN